MWKVVKEGEYPEVEFTHREPAIVCDNCKCIVPQAYVEFVDMAKAGLFTKFYPE